MSVDAGLEIFFGNNTSTGTILRTLTERGWRGDNEFTIDAIDLEDGRSKVALRLDSIEHDASELDAKLAHGEPFTITMKWQSSEQGGEFIFSIRDQMTFSPSINRMTLDQRLTDVNWYLARIISSQERTAAKVESWTWRESA